MKYIKLIPTLILAIISSNINAQPSNQISEVISSGGGESSGSNYSNFGVMGEAFVNCTEAGDFINYIGFLQTDKTTTGIYDIGFLNNLNIYSNPNAGNFVLEMNITRYTDLNIKLFNIIGQIVYEEKISTYSGIYHKEIILSETRPGIYYLVIQSKEGLIGKDISVF